MHDIIVRPAGIPDLPGLMELYGQLHPGAQPPSAEDAARILDEFARYPGSAVYLGVLGSQPVSTCALVVVPNLSRGGTPFALIENVVTDAAHRGQGFARRVLRHAVSAAWDRGCYKVMLMTGSTDQAVLRFYEGAGFEQSKTGLQIRRLPERAQDPGHQALPPAQMPPRGKIRAQGPGCHWISTHLPVE
jgi:GNAT superfamily N-acetyltransferase